MVARPHSHPQLRRPGDRAGMAGATLLDLLLVVTILGIVTAVAVRATDDDDLQLDAAARAIAADLQEAQALAIETRTAVGLRFDVANARTWFVLDQGDRPAAAKAALSADPSLDPGDVSRLLAARSRGDDGFAPVRIAAADFGGNPQVTFLADGTPRDGGAAELRLGELWLRVRVQAGTGRIAVTAP